MWTSTDVIGNPGGSQLASLHIALNEGFVDETVVIKVDDREVYRKDSVTERTQISFSDSFEMTVQEGSVKIEVVLPLRGLSRTTVEQVTNDVFLGIALSEGRILIASQGRPFRYA